MSNKYNNAVQRLKPLSGHAARLVLWYLADHANDIGVAYASYETLMAKCDIRGRDTVARVLQELVDLGILSRKARFKNCNKYVLSMESIEQHSLTIKLQHESKFDDQTITEGTGDSYPAQGSAGDCGVPSDSLISGGDSLITHVPNSLISGGDSLITQTHSFCLPAGENSTRSLPTVSGADAPLCANDDSISTDKSKTRSTPSNSGTAVPEPQPGTSRPETHGVSLPQERPRVPLAPETLEQIMARQNVAIAEMDERRARYYAEGGDDL